MKRSFAFVFLLLLLPLVSAVQINMNSNYSQGSTLLASVSGNFLNQIQQQNVLLYNGHVRISFIPFVQKMGDTFYLYGQLLGKEPGNYSVVISGVNYMESGINTNNNIVQNFTITNASSDFSVSPGFIESNNTFVINVQNLAANTISVQSFLENTTATASTNQDLVSSILGSQSSSIQLTSTSTTNIASGQTVPVSFFVNASSSDQLIYAVLQTNNTAYAVPVFIPSNTSSSVSPPPSFFLAFQPSQETFSMSTNSNLSTNISLYNLGENQTVNLSLSGNLLYYITVPPQIAVGTNSTVQIPINVTSGPITNLIEGQIIATSPNSTSYFALTLNFSASHVGEPNVTTFQTCSQFNGNFCNSSLQTCQGQITNTFDTSSGLVCCVGTCQVIQNNSGSTVIIWIGVALVFLFIVFLIVRRFRGAHRQINLLDTARGR